MCTVLGRKYSRECYLRRSAQQLLVFRIYILYNSLLQYTLDSHLSADQIATLIVSSQIATIPQRIRPSRRYSTNTLCVLPISVLTSSPVPITTRVSVAGLDLLSTSTARSLLFGLLPICQYTTACCTLLDHHVHQRSEFPVAHRASAGL